jgi:hypothetical protein
VPARGARSGERDPARIRGGNRNIKHKFGVSGRLH